MPSGKGLKPDDLCRGQARGAVVRDGATASMFIAGRGPAKQKRNTGMSPPTGSNHDVSILITAVDVAGRVRDEAPRWNVSMTLTPRVTIVTEIFRLGLL